MSGGAGNDTYVVDNAGDVVIEVAGERHRHGASRSVSFTLGANVENLTLTGSADINGTGNGLANTITGNAGDNVLDGGAGADTMSGGAGNDTYVVDNAGDVVIEAPARAPTRCSRSISFTLGANVENLTLTGSAAHQRHRQRPRQLITGNAGDNVLDGGAGADTMTGGARQRHLCRRQRRRRGRRRAPVEGTDTGAVRRSATRSAPTSRT